MYIDDCNVFGKDIDELISRLRLVFERFRKHKIFLKPNKCYLGYAEIDYVGKVLSADGFRMSRTVLDFPKPVLFKQLKSFLDWLIVFTTLLETLLLLYTRDTSCFLITISIRK